MINVRVGGASDVGRVRTKNEDSWFTDDNVFAVADGMGGHQGGEVASQSAVEVLQAEITEPTAAALVDAAHAANDAIFTKAETQPHLRGMGTTLCAMAIVTDDDGEDELAVINVGDSRLYQFRDNTLTQVTRDHSLVEDMRASGQITEAEAAVHPHRNIVTRALGISPTVDIDEFVVVPRTDDRYVIASDGLFNEVSADQISATLRRLVDPQDTAAELVRLANVGGGRDNITCVIVDVVDDGGRADRAAEAGVAPIRSRPRRADHRDVAGFTSASKSNDSVTMHHDTVANEMSREAAPEKSRKERIRKGRIRKEASTDAEQPRLRRSTWRTMGFVVLLVAVVAVAVVAIGWYSRGTYYIGFDKADQVTIFKGRPTSFLWFDATVEKRTGIYKAQVPPLNVDAVAKGKQFGSVAEAKKYLVSMRTLICSNLRNGGKTTAVPGAPTTTIPAQCAADFTPTTTTTVPSTTAAPTTKP